VEKPDQEVVENQEAVVVIVENLVVVVVINQKLLLLLNLLHPYPQKLEQFPNHLQQLKMQFQLQLKLNFHQIQK